MSVNIERLIELMANAEPESRIVRHWTLGGGISCSMIGLEILRIDGEHKKLVVREVGQWSFENYPKSVYHEFELLGMLGDLGIPAARPRMFDLSCEILDRPYLVLDYVEGSPDLETDDKEKRVRIMAEHLAKIHSIDIKYPALAFMAPSPVNIRAAGDSLNEGLRESEIRSVLAGALPAVVENQYTFRHGDFWPGNMIWNEGELAAVIDWEETSIGDPLFDVAITRLDTLWAYGPEAMRTFTEVYQSKMDIDYTHLPFWDLRVSLRPIASIDEWAISFPQLGRPDITAETMKEGHRWFVDSAFDCLGVT